MANKSKFINDVPDWDGKDASPSGFTFQQFSKNNITPSEIAPEYKARYEAWLERHKRLTEKNKP